MKQTKKSKVANKKTTKVVKVKKRKITSMVKSVDKKIKKPTKITSFKKIVKNEPPKKNKKIKLDITYESKKLSEIKVPRNITDKDIIVINDLNAINKEVEELPQSSKALQVRTIMAGQPSVNTSLTSSIFTSPQLSSASGFRERA